MSCMRKCAVAREARNYLWRVDAVETEEQAASWLC